MLQNEIAFRMQDILLKHLVRKTFYALQSVWRVGKDDIELLSAYRKKVEYIGVDCGDVGETEPGGFSSDEVCVVLIHIDRIYPGSAAGCKFVCNGAGPAEQVQNLEVLKFVFVVKDIEKTLFCKVCSRPRPLSCGWKYSLSL